MKIADVIARVRRAYQAQAGFALIEDVIRATIRELGLEVAPDGEVYNPAPAPAWKEPREFAVRFRTPKRRR